MNKIISVNKRYLNEIKGKIFSSKIEDELWRRVIQNSLFAQSQFYPQKY